MKSRLFTFFCILFIFVSVAQAEEIEWFTDLNTAAKAAKKSGKPILLDFTAKWCGPCKKMDREFWVREDVIELSKKVIFVKIDSDNNIELKKKYGVRGIPNVTITDSWGLKLTYHAGYSTARADEIIEKIGSVPTDFAEIKNAGNLLEKDANDIISLAEIAAFYQKKNFYAPSNELYLRILELEKTPSQREVLKLNLGFNYLRMGKITEAEDIFMNFQAEFPKSKNADMALHGEIFILVKQKKIPQAEKLFEKLKTDFPRSLMISQANQILSDAKLQ